MPNIYLIKDLARLSGYSVYTIKYYLKIGLIQELGRTQETNYRYFGKENVHELALIRSLRKQRKSLKEIKNILNQR